MEVEDVAIDTIGGSETGPELVGGKKGIACTLSEAEPGQDV